MPSRDRSGSVFTEPRPSGSVFAGKSRPLPYGRGSEKDFLNTLSGGEIQ